MKKILFLLILMLPLPLSAAAQSFSTGSTGADGALDLSTGACQRQIQLPESGILNYTTINIPANCGVSFKLNFRNTPIILFAQGDVTIAGNIYVGGGCGVTRLPGPGGFYAGGTYGQTGFGPGGGTAESGDGNWGGSLSLVPIIGGSGGYNLGEQNGPGHGGGAIVIASSTSINMFPASSINAGGGYCGTSAGSGGAIRLVANNINVSGSLNASGRSHHGVIRIEAPAGALQYNGLSTPLPILSITINPQIVSGSSTPSLKIVSIGGYTVSYTTGRPDSVDLMLPNSLGDPVGIAVQATNIPVGTLVRLNISGSPKASYSPGTLSGTQASSSTTISVAELSRSSATFILVYAEFTLPPETARYNSNGPDQVTKVRVEAALGSKEKFAFLRSNGSAINAAQVPEAIRKIFGQ